ncbi:hypothetical protein NBRC116188_12870 [Oceaniserpentilla sp. 4NH20-0058]|uniref:DUF6164 family protein n=1 Tax=Oceaniserpentilla sp. 4NH20-0058 TaxID=3127660 RepID=UPI0031092484
MSVLLLKLKHVPEDEYQEVCALLEQNDFHFYETTPGFWGVGLAAIWLNDQSQLEQAQAVLSEYMLSRQQRVRQELSEAKQQGQLRTLLSTFKLQPATFILYLLAVVGIFALTTLPFLGLL